MLYGTRRKFFVGFLFFSSNKKIIGAGDNDVKGFERVRIQSVIRTAFCNLIWNRYKYSFLFLGVFSVIVQRISSLWTRNWRTYAWNYVLSRENMREKILNFYSKLPRSWRWTNPRKSKNMINISLYYYDWRFVSTSYP